MATTDWDDNEETRNFAEADPGGKVLWIVCYSLEDRRPATTAEVIAAFEAKKLNAYSLVWREGMTNWDAIGNVPHLVQAISTVAKRKASQNQLSQQTARAAGTLSPTVAPLRPSALPPPPATARAAERQQSAEPAEASQPSAPQLSRWPTMPLPGTLRTGNMAPPRVNQTGVHTGLAPVTGSTGGAAGPPRAPLPSISSFAALDAPSSPYARSASDGIFGTTPLAISQASNPSLQQRSVPSKPERGRIAVVFGAAILVAGGAFTVTRFATLAANDAATNVGATTTVVQNAEPQPTPAVSVQDPAVLALPSSAQLDKEPSIPAPSRRPGASRAVQTATPSAAAQATRSSAGASAAVIEPEPDSASPSAEGTTAVSGGFDNTIARTALNAAVARAQSCLGLGLVEGATKIAVTYEPSGMVRAVRVLNQDFAKPPLGQCLESAFMVATVPAFTGDAVTVTKTLSGKSVTSTSSTSE